MAYWLDGFRRWSDFDGRGTRRETFVFLIIVFVLGVIADAFMGAAFPDHVRLVDAIAGLVVFLLSISVIVKRLHDAGLNGKWIFINWIPFLGWLVLLVLLFLPPSDQDNKYGANPRAAPRVADKRSVGQIKPMRALESSLNP